MTVAGHFHQGLLKLHRASKKSKMPQGSPVMCCFPHTNVLHHGIQPCETLRQITPQNVCVWSICVCMDLYCKLTHFVSVKIDGQNERARDAGAVPALRDFALQAATFLSTPELQLQTLVCQSCTRTTSNKRGSEHAAHSPK